MGLGHDGHMTTGDDIDIKEIQALLEQHRRRLQALAGTAGAAAAVVELDQSRVGRLSRMDALQSQAMSQENLRRRDIELRRISAAQARVAAGDYGFCLACGEPIAAGRLRIDPAATLCIRCAGQHEQ